MPSRGAVPKRPHAFFECIKRGVDLGCFLEHAQDKIKIMHAAIDRAHPEDAFRRSAEWYMESSFRSVPAQSTMVSLPPAAPHIVQTDTRNASPVWHVDQGSPLTSRAAQLYYSMASRRRSVDVCPCCSSPSTRRLDDHRSLLRIPNWHRVRPDHLPPTHSHH